MQFSFTVPGKAIPKARPRLGRGRRAFTPQTTLDYEARVKEACLPAIPAGWPLDCDYKVTMNFYFADETHGDLDNHAKMLDGLNPKVKRVKRKVVWREEPFVWADDKRVRKLTIERFYVDEHPRLEVTIEACPRTSRTKRRTTRPTTSSPSVASSAPGSSTRKPSSPRSRRSRSPFDVTLPANKSS